MYMYNALTHTLLTLFIQAAIMNAGDDILTYARLLLEAGADPNAYDHFGYTPMTSLLKRGFRDGANVDDKHAQVAQADTFLLKVHVHVHTSHQCVCLH